MDPMTDPLAGTPYRALDTLGEGGMGDAHRVGIIHRDVKLDNVFMATQADGGEPIVKVLDFGIAKVMDLVGSPPLLKLPKYPTAEGVLVGSPRTCSPEQARFQRVDA